MDVRRMYLGARSLRASPRLAGTLLAASSVFLAVIGMAVPDVSRAEQPAVQVTKALIGNWSLVSTRILDANGSVMGSLYKDPTGKLTYTQFGHMWVNAGERDRTTGPDTSIWYTGTFTVHPETSEVFHHVEFSSPLVYQGTDQIRHYTLEGNQLVLYDPTSPVRIELSWTRRPTGQRAAALKKCTRIKGQNKKATKKARTNCRKRASWLPV